MVKIKRLLSLAGGLVFMLSLVYPCATAWAQGQPLTFSAYGDIPYGSSDYPILQQHIADHNRYSPSAFLLHIGDMLSGSCDESKYADFANFMKGLAVPAYIVVGDNEYNDCDDPVAALALWKKYFLTFGESFCGAPYTEHQSVRPENIAFTMNGVLFVGINLVGGSVHDQNEWDTRMQQDADWVSQQFQAKVSQVRAAVVFAQTGNRSAVVPFTTQFRAAAAAFAKPVLYIHGDLHTYKFDQPWPEKNITRLEVPKGDEEPPLEVTINMNTIPAEGMGMYTVKRNPWDGVQPYNMPPCVNAGPDQSLSGLSATLMGQATDDGDPNGTLTTMWSKVSGPGTVTFGSANTLTTTASFSTDGTYILRLTADDGALQKSDDVTVVVNSGNTNVYSLVINTVGSGNVNADPSGGTYNDGTVVTLTATPANSYQFSGWSGDLTGTTNPATLTMNANKSVTATFTAIQRTLTVSTVGSGSVALNPTGGTYNDGTVVTLTATPAAGFQFSGWSGDMTGSTNPATLTMNANKSVTATFTAIQRTLTVSTVGSGSVTLNPTGGTYNDGTVVTLTATPASGYQFSGWSGDLTGTANPATITMNSNKTVAATFTAASSIVFRGSKTGSSANSTAVMISASMSAVKGHLYLAAISMQPKVSVDSVSGLGLNWKLVKTQCAGRNSTGLEVWMAQGKPTANGIVTAYLASAPTTAVIAVSRYSGVASSNPIGNVIGGNSNGLNGACTGGVNGNSYSLNLTTTVDNAVVFGAAAMKAQNHVPGAGYTERAEIKKLDPTKSSSVAMEDKSLVTASTVAVNGSFTNAVDWAMIGLEIRPPIQYKLNMNSAGSGSVVLNPPGGIYNSGTKVTLTATPAAGFQFSGWSGDLSGSTNPATITMNANKSVTATFIAIQRTLTVSTVGSGSVALNPPGGTYNDGTIVTLTATPAAGFQFSGWSGDLSGSTNPATLTMNANKNVTATFTASSTDPNMNLAKGKSTTASSSYLGKPPSNAVDGSTSTYWRSDGSVSSSNPIAWLRVDLGAALPVGRAIIKWKESYYAKSYELQVSNDDANWTKVYSTTAGSSGTQQFTFPQTMARYVRLYHTENNKSNYQIYELEIYSGSNTAAKRSTGMEEATAAAAIPSDFVLEQNFPNPFNPSSQIRFGLPAASYVTIKVFNINGAEIANLVAAQLPAGTHSIVFNAGHLPAGAYFYVMQAGETRLVRRLMLVK